MCLANVWRKIVCRSLMARVKRFSFCFTLENRSICGWLDVFFFFFVSLSLSLDTIITFNSDRMRIYGFYVFLLWKRKRAKKRIRKTISKLIRICKCYDFHSIDRFLEGSRDYELECAMKFSLNSMTCSSCVRMNTFTTMLIRFCCDSFLHTIKSEFAVVASSAHSIASHNDAVEYLIK